MNVKSGDVAWMVIAAGAIVYELTADDLLSEATQRYCAHHPWLTRLIITAVAGHLGGAMPACIDVFSAKNLLHRWIVEHYPITTANRHAAATLPQANPRPVSLTGAAE
jgi:hypothetical protein